MLAPTNESARYDPEQWEAWEAKERGRQSMPESWCELASVYVPGVDIWVLTTNDDDYQKRGVAKSDQFPDAEAYIAYKRFCALWFNFREHQQDVTKAVHLAAFGGETEANLQPTLGSTLLQAPKDKK